MDLSLGTTPRWPGPAVRPVEREGTYVGAGGSFQVLVYAGVDPLTGKDHYLTESTRDESEAQKILTRLLAQVDEQRNPRTKATLGAALAAWLRTLEAEATTLDGYRGYVRRTIEPALGRVAVAKITPQVLEEFYAELRRCRHRCRNGQPAVDHRTTAAHECRGVRHGGGLADRDAVSYTTARTAGCVVIECPPHVCKPMAASTIRQVHWIVSSALAAAVRWEWIRSNPADNAKKPKQRAAAAGAAERRRGGAAHRRRRGRRTTELGNAGLAGHGHGDAPGRARRAALVGRRP